MDLLDILGLREKKEFLPLEEWPVEVVQLNDNIFTLFIKKYPLSLVDFWAPWCGPCKTISSRVKRLSKIYTGQVAFGKLNVQQHKKIADEYHVTNIPYLVFFSYGKKIASIVGAKSMVDIKRKIDSLQKKFHTK
jgi:thioredoxin 1